ncbi:MAG: hypothetical protein Q7W56_10330 [Candidatus Latescibacteria bacterium]|nr:hypothetical protein [Candidatus Latescibacterota bacterium]
MTLRIQTLPEPRPGVAALRLDGTVVRGDHRRFAAAAEACLGAGASGLVLDLADLNSISGELADEIALLWRRLSDEGAPVAVVGASVVVGWFLRRRLGEMPLLECATVEKAATAVATNSGGSEPPPVRTPRPSARPSLAAVAAFLDVLGRGGPCADWTAALTGLLRSQGLGRDAHLLRCDGDRLFLDGHPDALAEAGSRLGAMLAGADAPLTLHELKAGGLTARELTFLRWSGADLAVPLRAAGVLQGALFVSSGRDGGLFAFRPGELLGLGLLGCLIGEKLTQPSRAARIAGAADRAPEVAEDLLVGV